MIWLCLNLQVAERALFLWNSDHIQNLIKQNNRVILPIVLPALEQNARNHWNQAVRSLTINVSKIFSDFDPAFYEECMIKFREDEAQENDVKSKCEARWKRLEEMGGMKAPTNEPVLVSPKAASRYATPGKASRTQLEWYMKGGKSWKYKSTPNWFYKHWMYIFKIVLEFALCSGSLKFDLWSTDTTQTHPVIFNYSIFLNCYRC